MANKYRDVYCGEVTKEYVGKETASKAIEEGIYYFVKECVPMIWNETVQQMDFSKCFVYK